MQRKKFAALFTEKAMRLYRLEETRKPTKKKPWQWRACVLDNRGWRSEGWSSNDGFSQSRELYNNWRANMAGHALQMGTDSESSKPGFYCTYFLVREPWPETVVADLLARIDALESEMRGLLAREYG